MPDFFLTPNCYHVSMSQKILLIEDSLLDAELTIHALKRCDFHNEVVHAVDGGVALWHLAVDQTIALILLDLKLRVVSGIEFLTMFRADIKNAATPVIILSGSVNPEDRARAEQLGASSYVVKDPDPERFRDALCRTLMPFKSGLS